MSTDNKKSLWVRPHNRQYSIQPVKHMLENHVSMPLAGIKDDIGKDWYDLIVASSSLQEFLAQAAHLGPEPDTCHTKIPLETVRQVLVKPFLLNWGQLKIFRDFDWISGCIPSCKIASQRSQPYLMANHSKSILACYPTNASFRIKGTVKHN